MIVAAYLSEVGNKSLAETEDLRGTAQAIQSFGRVTANGKTRKLRHIDHETLC